MKREKFEEVIKYFLNVVSEQLDNMKDRHLWLEGNKAAVLTKMYMEVIFKDIAICEEYIKGKLILDFGTGGGYIAMLFAALGYDVRAIDIEGFKKDEEIHKTIVEDQRTIWPIFEKKYPNLHFKYYKDKIPYKNNFFDGIIAYAVIEHIPDVEIPDVMKEIRRVLKPDGFLFISRLPRKLAWTEHVSGLLGFRHHDRLYGDKEIKRLLEKYNFEIIEKSFTDMLPVYPTSFTNPLFPFLKIVDKFLLFTPLKYFSHDIRVMCRKIKV